MKKRERPSFAPESVTIRRGLEGIDTKQLTTLYRRAPLRRPLLDPTAVEKMLAPSLIISAWSEDKLLGVARVLTDGVAFSMICDVAVEPDFQGSGIGTRIMTEVMNDIGHTRIVACDPAVGPEQYKKYGFERASDVWIRYSA